MALAQSKLAVATAKPVLVAYGSTGPLVQDSPSLSPVWVDTHAKTFVVGFVWLYQDNTCRLYPGQQGISAIRAPLHGKVFFTQENLTNPPGSWCAGHTYLYWVARYTWTDADETTLEDPVTLQSTDVYQGYTSTDNYSFAAMFAHIVADPVAASGSNAQGTQQDVANSNLIDPPQGAARYTWTMTGGAGILAFSNGAPSMTTTTSTAPVVSLNGASDTINVSVTVSYPAGSNSLSYGPTPYTYCPKPTITSISPNVWFAGQTYNNVTITGTGFTTTSAATTSCPATKVLTPLTTPSRAVIALGTATVNSPTQITIATVAPPASETTEGVTVSVSGEASPQPNADVLETPSITWTSDPDGSNPVIAGPHTTSPNPPAVVGQQILLTTTPTAATLAALPVQLSFSTNPPQNPWNVTGTAVGGYPTVPSMSIFSGSISLTPLSSTCRSSSTCTLYWVSGTSPTVRYNYTLTSGQTSPTVSATFDVQGPSAIALTTPTISPVTIGLYTGYLYMGMFVPPDTPGIVFNATLQQPTAAQGTIVFVQYINQYNYQWTTSGGCPSQSDGPGIDTGYPFDESSVGATTSSTNDSPAIPLYSNATAAQASFNATMYLMWQPSLPATPVIPVPLGSITWQWSGDAEQNGGTWSFAQQPASPTASIFQPSASYPPDGNVLAISTTVPCGLHF